MTPETASEWEAETMRGDRWWHVAFGTTVVVLAILDGTTWSRSEAWRVGGWVVLGLLTLAYVTIGRLALRGGRFVLPFSLLIIVGSGAAVACSPNMAVIQAISFPILWMTIPRTRLAVVANVALALSVSAGFVIGLGPSPDSFAQAAVVESISLVFSLALGSWISRIAELSAERQRLLDELTATQEQLAVIHRDSGITSERERLAREIHDTIAQSLTGLVMLSQRARRELAVTDLAALDEQLELLEENARDVLAETRSLVAATAPVELGGGIAAALERLAARFERETGIRVTFETETTVEFGRDTLGRDTEVVLLRSAQEALSNVRKHSGAGSATVELAGGDGMVSLTVNDDGAGFETSAAGTGFGLPGMRDRLALVGGTLELRSSPGAGTTLTVSLPVGASA
ncbi:MAG TPA: sensor histidine kinase [Lacisediminihabitans sp.]|uniref:sensor histidine kinase n=1 Tax=Lacisediminihabitans sp. TaxID=2787631 RepID=UPI002ED8F610